MTRTVSALILAALVTAGCFKTSTSTSPTSATASLAGTWSTVQSLGNLATSCTNFRWAVTEFNGTTGSGTFTATCMGNMQVAGTASGTISGINITWIANATADVPGQPTCVISIGGTAVMETERIRIPYSGTACGAAVSGTEFVKK